LDLGSVGGLRHEAYRKLCAERLGGDDAQRVAREATARVLRRLAERNVEDWRQETEEILLRSPMDESDGKSRLG
jgi:hypothetical protein